ncbi:c-type cytochrome [Oricola cellulosilytica]|uniref:C-type cytochrome n=1 Tax=Oricola cellulosilytica TaxID=1429082 RepID=A0A4R0PBN4_9HYPH|nr:cytochrome c [Oricola cellulosilytica]TCD14860.1 c-type cytochrome [Oricola cellulosilytica]
MGRRVTISVLAVVAVLAVVSIGLRNRSEMGEGAPPRTGPAMVSVSVPVLAGVAKEGEALFAANCASCHGVNAAGQEGIAPPLVHIIYEPNHHSDAAFHLAVQQGVRAHHWRFGNMRPVDGVSEDDVEMIVAYVRALQRENGIE